ncbi:Serine threonine- kinase CTR1 [Chlorella sorokiniana]|uniref:Serine threonine-kinase CTR1 n=1 Tax=Chlorella sorokiniana TaxID=3076 RepID=A0A2P6U5A7_CHLSO|nr:Serine threonine- kinase CTR1 [Chlorella sorokiniana]|eukprot:PRW61504.1 Serine threonine- kinase CTR1 [Chlorella sorokiniana]
MAAQAASGWAEAFEAERQGLLRGAAGPITPQLVLEELRRAQEAEQSLRQQLAALQARTAGLQAQVCASQAENLQLRGALHVAKQAAEPSVVQLRQLLLDPAVNREFAGLRAELEGRTRELALAQAAVRFGGHGEPLLAKLDKLQDENADLRRQVGESRAQQLERALAAAREQLEDMRRVNAELEQHAFSLDQQAEAFAEQALLMGGSLSSMGSKGGPEGLGGKVQGPATPQPWTEREGVGVATGSSTPWSRPATLGSLEVAEGIHAELRTSTAADGEDLAGLEVEVQLRFEGLALHVQATLPALVVHESPLVLKVSEDPVLLLVDGFLSPQECSAVRELGSPHLKRSKVSAGDETPLRTSSSMFITGALMQHPVSLHLDAKVTALTQRYALHLDNRAGDCAKRAATCMVYLSDVEAGGATSFPRSTGFSLHKALEACAAGYHNEPAPPDSPAVVHSLRAKQQRPEGLRVFPKEGRAVIFWSRLPSGEEDKCSIHEAERFADTYTAVAQRPGLLRLGAGISQPRLCPSCGEQVKQKGLCQDCDSNLTSADGRFEYNIHTELLTWDEAAIACIKAGGQLAYIESEREWNQLAGAMKDLWLANSPTAPASSCPFCSCDTPTGQHCWWAFIGMWGTSTNRSSWRWLDPSPSNDTFQPHWEAGQPNYCGQPANEKSCAGMWAFGNLSQPLQLGDLPCNCSMPYICKTEVGANVSGCPFPDGTVIRCNISSDGSIYKIENGSKRGYPSPSALSLDNATVTINSADVCKLGDQCPDGKPMPDVEPLEVDVPYLLKQRDAITNWAAFKAGNNVSGWDEATEVCRWSYIHCRQDHAYAVTFSCAYANTKCTPKAIGTLAPELANAKHIFMLDIFGQQLSGTLPDGWGQNGTFPKLETVYLENNDFTGTLPPQWGTPRAFPRLAWLSVADSKRLYGTVPEAWAGNGSLPSIKRIDLYGTAVCGSVPPSLLDPVCELRSDWLASNGSCIAAAVPSSNGGSSVAGIAGGVAAGVVVAVAATAVVLVYRRRRRRRLAGDEKRAGLSQPQTPSLSSAGESLGSSGGRLSRPAGSAAAGPADLSGDAFMSFFTQAPAGASSTQPPSSGQPVGSTGLTPRSGSAALLQPWEVSFDSITILSVLGCGSFGKVFLGRWHESQVAVKMLLAGKAEHVSSAEEAHQLLELSSPLMQRVEAEAALLASFRHPHVVAFYAICRVPPCIITEYCSRGSLAQLMADARQDASLAAELTWSRRLTVALQTALGMLYLHSRSPPLVHRDLKSPNLLLDEGFTVKVTGGCLGRRNVSMVH